MATEIKLNFIKHFVKQLLDLIARDDPTNIDEIKVRFEKLDNYAKNFEILHTDLMLLDENKNRQKELYDEFYQFDNDVHKIMAVCSKPPFSNLNQSTGQPSLLDTTHVTQLSDQLSSYKRLPKLTIPSFSGDVLSWHHFEEAFTNLIDSNEYLSDSDKFQHLKLNLSGEPLSLVKNLLVNSSNYRSAWELLKNRYDNPRHIVSLHVHQILSIPVMQSSSLDAFKSIVGILNENIATLKTLKLPVDEWSFLLAMIVLSKLDYDTRNRFEHSLHDHKTYIKFEDLLTFLENQISILESTGEPKRTLPYRPSQVNRKHDSSARAPKTFLTRDSNQCDLCKKPHLLFKCPVFAIKTITERRMCTQTNNLCFNCLRPGHGVNQCPSIHSCRVCQRRHHSLLHLEPLELHSEPLADSTPSPNEPTSSLTLTQKSVPTTTVMLATALADVLDADGNRQTIRLILDSGSRASYITAACVRRFNLKYRRMYTPIYSLGNVPIQTAGGMAFCTLCPKEQSTKRFELSALVVKAITSNVPSVPINTDNFPHVRPLKLADPQAGTPAPVDMLIGADLFPHIYDGRRVSGPPGQPVAALTAFGWVLLGKASSAFSSNETSHNLLAAATASSVQCYHMSNGTTLEKTLRTFREGEEVSSFSTSLHPEEIQAESLFVNSIPRDESGRYSVALPFREYPPSLGDSYYTALRNFKNLQRRLTKNPDSSEQHYCLSHHCILPPESFTKKLHEVFNGSRPTSNGKSLNDVLLQGPFLQQNIVSILLRARFHKIILTADVRRMYRQIQVHSNHRKFQRILWSFDFNKPPSMYELSTVTYGLNCAPFLALRTFLQLAQDEGHLFPSVARVIRENTYVDDVITGCDSVEEARVLQQDIEKMFQCGAFELRKWASNNPQVLDHVPAEHKQFSDHTFDDRVDLDTTIKVLGLRWNPAKDYFFYKITPIDRKCTKRVILSEVAKIFDPMGWLAPISMFAKRIIQRLWSLSLDWDATPPGFITTQWKLFQEQLGQLSDLRIPRHISSSSSFDLVGFCDASWLCCSAL